VKALTAGGLYNELAKAPQFAFTPDTPAVVGIIGNGPSDTVFITEPARR
jgi:hypothetical protein